MSYHRDLGSLAFIFDIIPTLWRNKMSRSAGDGLPEAGTPEFDYMLATLVFDLVRKMAYAHKALRAYALHADPELTNRVLGDIEGMREMEAEQDYRALAERTHELMLDAVRETAPDHKLLMEMVRAWSQGRPYSEG